MKDKKNEACKVEEAVDHNLDAVKDEMEVQNETVEVDVLEEFKKMQEENEQLRGKFLRMTADFQNYKKRIEKEKSDIYNYANEKLIIDLLPIIDNLERAVQSLGEEGKEESFIKGIDMILQQFLDILKKNGVQEIAAIDENFDPNYHHAVMQEEHPDYETNKIIEVFQKGYMLNEKVIRPAMVKVAN
jgi:molecular chaperone GrpE